MRAFEAVGEWVKGRKNERAVTTARSSLVGHSRLIFFPSLSSASANFERVEKEEHDFTGGIEHAKELRCSCRGAPCDLANLLMVASTGRPR